MTATTTAAATVIATAVKHLNIVHVFQQYGCQLESNISKMSPFLTLRQFASNILISKLLTY